MNEVAETAEVNTKANFFREYYRPLELEREANESIKASCDLGEVSLGNGKKVALSIVKMDDFPVETSSGETVVEDAYLLRRVYGDDSEDLSEFKDIGEPLELSDEDKERILYAMDEVNLPASLAVSVSLDEYEKSHPIEWKKLCKDRPLLIGLTGSPGMGKTGLVTFLARNGIYALSSDNATYYNTFTYHAYTDRDTTAKGTQEGIIKLRKTGKKKKRPLPQYNSGVNSYSKMIDLDRVDDYLFVDCPPNWRERAKRGVAPEPHVFDMMVSGLGVVIDVSTLADSADGLTPENMEDAKEYIQSDDFDRWIKEKIVQEEKVVEFVRDALS